jgi:ferric-dicitrate binding protein FerR (iron transport regulator)
MTKDADIRTNAQTWLAWVDAGHDCPEQLWHPPQRIAAGVATGLAAVFSLISSWSPANWRPSEAQPTHRTSTGSLITRLGEYRCERLPDESEVCLNTNSAIRYTFNRSTRNIELVSGEASFVVRKDKSRPFYVLSGGALIQDLSTSFDVYRRRDSTQVAVIEGRIRIIAPINNPSRLKFARAEADSAWKAAPEFHKLQQMEFDEATGTLHVLPVLTEQRLSQLLAWHQGRLDLTERTVGEALDEFARYQPISKFSYSDKSLSQIRVGGDMGFTHLDDFLAALEHEFHIHHTTTGTDGNTVVTLSRQRNNITGTDPRKK